VVEQLTIYPKIGSSKPAALGSRGKFRGKTNTREISKIPIEITGLLEALALSDTEPSGSSLRWRSEVDLKSEDSSRPHLSSMTEDSLGNGSGRKISPPLAAVLSDASRIRLVKETLEPK
jgi:hypothetical protein